jgi:segregation and condensation protein B
MNEFYVRNVIEAALLAAGKPLQLAEIGKLFDENARPKAEDLRAALDALAADYVNRSVEVKETAAGFRIQVRKEFSSEVSRLWPERPAKYTRALLETLALIAYRQPITRAEIEAVRGVAVNPNIIKTVIERNWVRVVGHRDVPGRPELLGTTREFLDYFGLRSLDELPTLADIKAMTDINPQLEFATTPALEGPAPGEATALADGGAVAILESGDAVAVIAASVGVAGVDVEAVAADGAPATDTVGVGDSDAAEAASADKSGADAANVDATASAGTESTVHADDAVASNVQPEADEETAERTLAAGEDSGSESDDSDAQADEVSNESSDAVDELSDDDGDEDELSADGNHSRELVAAPRDLED